MIRRVVVELPGCVRQCYRATGSGGDRLMYADDLMDDRSQGGRAWRGNKRWERMSQHA